MFAGQAVAGAESQGESKDAYRAGLKQLNSFCGNSITLLSLLTHNWNCWHMRLIVQCLHLFAKEPAFELTQKISPDHLSQISLWSKREIPTILLGMCCFQCRPFCTVWSESHPPNTAPQDSSPETDEQCGMMPGLKADTLPGHIVGFPVQLLEEHYWQCEFKTNSWPISFASLLHEDKHTHAEQWEKHRDIWECTCAIESAAREWPGLAKLRDEALFMDHMHMQLIFI